MINAIRKHEELLEVYERLGMFDMLEKERAQYIRVCAYYGYHPKRTAYDGSPFLIICEFSTYARNAAGQPVCLRSTAACPNFKEGER